MNFPTLEFPISLLIRAERSEGRRPSRSEASLKFFKFAVFIKNRPYERRKSIDRILGYLKVAILISDDT